jgi:hypothetical protein
VKEKIETMSTMTAVELIRQTHPEVFTEMTRTEDNRHVVAPMPVTGMLVRCVFGFALWVGIMLVLLAIY